MSGKQKTDILTDFGGSEFSRFKPALADLAVEKISPIADEMRRLQADPTEIDTVLRRGSERASQIAMETISDVKEIVDFVGARG